MEQQMIDWIEANTTLHRTVEFLYVVDGYECTVCHDDHPIAGPFKGETLREAVAKAMVGVISA
ncbi:MULTISPECIES: hypothetical protein [unclassified Ensifer]|uniref:hypothetical protein n=1 Tax=unclassified Ensifer TaxID=2633371 RepID=UPI000813758A|nr:MULTISPECIES: hypothetical protein [unclassified Ensifer]OCP21944.1 hypothetical protein BC361_25585 [Ensifer sp. LC54]OCP23276.1 hypothetical protein BC363_25180 [Ensifer sp. LC384]